MAKENLALYSANCKRCGHLDPDEKQKFNKCHFSKGNEDCPASEVQLVVVGKAKRWATLALGARQKRDVATEARILAQVAQQSGPFQTRFYDDLESLERDLCVRDTNPR